MCTTIATAALGLLLAVVSTAGCRRTPKPPKNPNAATQATDRIPFAGKSGPWVEGWTPPINAAARRMKELGIAVWNYQLSHGHVLPPDFGAVIPEFIHGTPDDCFQTPGDQRRTDVPDPITADWANSHASYFYLATNVDLHRITQPGTVICFHTRLDQPFDSPKLGKVIIVMYVDCHAGLIPVAQAPAETATSLQRLSAARPPGRGSATTQPSMGRPKRDVPELTGSALIASARRR